MKKLNGIKLIATDLDGTLMNRHRKLSERTVRALKALDERGVHIVIATGRFYRDIASEMENYGLHPYYILMNGAEFRAPDGKLLSEINLKPEDVFTSLAMFRRENALPEMYTDAGEYLIATPEESFDEFKLRMRIMQPMVEFTEEELKNHPRYLSRQYAASAEELVQAGIGIRKIICFEQDEERVKAWKAEIARLPDVVSLSSSPKNIEITDRTAQKGLLLHRVLKQLNLKPEEVCVFGDGENDLSLFTMFEYSVAMENAVPEITERAAYVTDHHDEDGVAKFIEEYIL